MAKKQAVKKTEKILEFRIPHHPGEAGEMDDAYTSVECMLTSWLHYRELYDEVGRGGMTDLAVRVTRMIEPFRSFFRAHEKWDGYDFKQQLERARQAEKTL